MANKEKDVCPTILELGDDGFPAQWTKERKIQWLTDKMRKLSKDDLETLYKLACDLMDDKSSPQK